MSAAEVRHADCLTALRDMPDASVDAVVTDPPYGLSNTRPDQHELRGRTPPKCHVLRHRRRVPVFLCC